MFDPKPFIAGLPHRPGVYRMVSASGQVLYVGKAGNLRRRVASYFQKTELSPRIRLMLGQVAQIEVTTTRSEAEALLLENNLIKALAPRYNILFRDDKSYPYVVVTGHAFPRIAFHRGSQVKTHRYFGPFPNAGAVREGIQLLQKLFRIRTCEDSVFANRARPCLLHQIQRCTAPCVGRISAADYAGDVRSAELFLLGKAEEAAGALEQRMHAAAAELRFEEAAAYRDQLASLQAVQQRQYVESSRSVDADVVACVAEAELVCVTVAMVRGGRHLGDHSYFPENAAGWGAEEALEAFLLQHYAGRPDIPPLILVSPAMEAGVVEEALASTAGRRIDLVTRPAGERRVWLEMATQNARIALGQRLARQSTQEERLVALRTVLDAPAVQRVECFDISHTMGEAAVASCVVFDRGNMQPGDYRRFNLRDTPAGDDYAAMREALARRYRRVLDGEVPMPDLLLIDGGVGQVGAARQSLIELGLEELMVVGVAKGEERKPGLEQLIFTDGREPLRLAPTHPALHLIQQIRDEAHRFAIQGHRARRGRARTASTLDEIDGIGPSRRRNLLTRFGGLKGVVAASVDDLAGVPGISRTLAAKIYQALH